MTLWSEHVHRYAKKHKLSYREAQKNTDCKEKYKRKKNKTSPRKGKKSPSRKNRRLNYFDLDTNLENMTRNYIEETKEKAKERKRVKFFDEDYELFVNDPNGIEEANETFSLGIYPNPTDGISTLDVNSTVAGKAIIEVYSITGSMVQSSVKTIRVGVNRLNLDITSVPAGIYLVKADISGSQALVRMQKK